jgi:ABC-type antimicrobial peptide transport system permease subunit
LPSGVGIDPLDGSLISTGGYGPSGVWISDYIEIPEGAKITEFACIAYRLYAFYAFYDENKQFISAEAAHGDPVPDDCIVMNYERYNETFGTSYTTADLDKFVPHKVTLAQYDYNDVEHTEPFFQKEVTIIALHTYTGATLFASQNVFELFRKDSLRQIGLYLNGSSGVGNVMQVMEELEYQPQSFTVEGIHTMTKAVDVFIPIFELIAIVLCVGVVFILFNFSSRMIKDKMHEIGILKALGTQNGTVGTVFGLQVMLIAIFTCILSVVGYYYFIDIANDVLIESLKRLAPEHVVLDLNFLTFQKDIARDNCILVFVLSVFALIPSMIKVKVIKPVKIIKTKD